MRAEIIKRPTPHMVERAYVVSTDLGCVTVIVGKSGALTSRAHFSPRADGYASAMDAAHRVVRDHLSHRNEMLLAGYPALPEECDE